MAISQRDSHCTFEVNASYSHHSQHRRQRLLAHSANTYLFNKVQIQRQRLDTIEIGNQGDWNEAFCVHLLEAAAGG